MGSNAEKKQLDHENTITIILPKSFPSKVQKAVSDEIEVASKKWKVRLSEAEKKTIVENVYPQLNLKVSETFGHRWELGETDLRVTLFSDRGWPGIEGTEVTRYGSTLGIKLEGVEIGYSPGKGFIITDRGEYNARPPKELYATVHELILRWARTAVFYGVSSVSPATVM